MDNCALVKVFMVCDVKCSILAHVLFILYIVNNIRQLNAIIHVDSIWSLAG